MATYTVRDEQSGKLITFQWDGAEPPTDADMSEVFAAAGSQSAPQPQPAPPREPVNQYIPGVGTLPQGLADMMPGLGKAAHAVLPAVGGVVGGAIGGVGGTVLGTPIAGVPGLVGGAGVGAAAGEALGQLLDPSEAPPDPGQVAKDIGIQGLAGAITSGTGAGALRAAPPFMRSAAFAPAVTGAGEYVRSGDLKNAGMAAVGYYGISRFPGGRYLARKVSEKVAEPMARGIENMATRVGIGPKAKLAREALAEAEQLAQARAAVAKQTSGSGLKPGPAYVPPREPSVPAPQPPPSPFVSSGSGVPQQMPFIPQARVSTQPPPRAAAPVPPPTVDPNEALRQQISQQYKKDPKMRDVMLAQLEKEGAPLATPVTLPQGQRAMPQTHVGVAGKAQPGLSATAPEDVMAKLEQSLKVAEELKALGYSQQQIIEFMRKAAQ